MEDYYGNRKTPHFCGVLFLVPICRLGSAILVTNYCQSVG